MRKIYWVDDNLQQVLHIVHGAIRKLWKLYDIEEEGIASKVIIFGNACEVADIDEITTEEEEKDAYNKIQKQFQEGCQGTDGPSIDRPMYTAKKRLIQEPVHFLYKEKTPGDSAAYIKMKKAWISENLNPSNGADYKNAAQEAELLIERMNLETDCLVGIDIALLYGDIDRLQKRNRILSMELCHKIKEMHLGCFLYSTEADDDNVRQNWQQLYSLFYGESDVRIYLRSDFMQQGNTGDKPNTDVVKEIEDMFEQRKDEG